MVQGRVLNKLQALSKLPSPGPAPAFTHIHVSQAILTIGDEGQIGRIELSRKLGVGEGAIRTVIKHLTQGRIVTIAKGGCVLTRQGRTLYDSLRSRVSKVSIIDARQLALDKVSAAILVKRSGRHVKRGIEQRDAAIRAGGTGACTLVFHEHQFRIPMSESEEWKLRPDDPLIKDITNALHPEEEDVVVISSAPDGILAKQGAMAAALTLIA